ncbi:MAG: hypothetical protein PHX09_00925 [Clostridia bacterium]|nr:hypothetical protein [Clostridia bacterium]
MKKNAVKESDKIIAKLTGQENSDKELLISSIRKLRDRKGFDDDIKVLGKQLYKILLENGLNESEVINASRLLGKIDGFIYQKKYDIAQDILEVLDSLEFCPLTDEKGQRIFYLNNLIEAAILWQFILIPSPKELGWTISSRNTYLILKAQILLEKGKLKEAEAVANYILKLNPVSFDAYIILAEIYKNTSAIKFKRYLFKAYDICYTTADLKKFLKELSYYYETKKDYTTAYAVLYIISFYDDISLIKSSLNRLIVEINKKATSQFSEPSINEIIQICQKEKVSYYIKEDIFKLVCNTYFDVLVNDYDNTYLVNACKVIVEDISRNTPDLSKKIEKIAQKARIKKKAK